MADMETTIGVDFYLSEIDVNGKKIKVCTYVLQGMFHTVIRIYIIGG